MAAGKKKPTNKAKFSLYLDRTVMKVMTDIGVKNDRSINYVVGEALTHYLQTRKTIQKA